MVGEGGNLGFTQLGRIEYTLASGLIYTDAIDNSAGVDCSDHEVNIKILLGDVMASGEMTLKQRNELLDEMTDEVAELVLDNNRPRRWRCMIARQQSLPMVNVHARYLDQLEREGWLDRALEFLPTDKQLAERQSTGAGLSTPEFAVLIAYTKNANVDRDPHDRPPRRSVLDDDLVEYFPSAVAAALPPYDPAPPAAARDLGDHEARQPDGQPLGHLVRPSHDRRHRGLGHRRRQGVGRRSRGARFPGVVGRDRFDRPTSRSTISSSSTSIAAAPPNAARCGSSGTAGHRSTSASRSTASAVRCRRSPPSSPSCLRGTLRDEVTAMTAIAGRSRRTRRAGGPICRVEAAAHRVRRDRARATVSVSRPARRAPRTGRCSTDSS